MELTEAKIAEIPYQTLGIFAMAKIGIDIKKKMSQPTYSRHRAILRAYGVDLDKMVNS